MLVANELTKALVAGCRASACAWVCLQTTRYLQHVNACPIQKCSVAAKQPVHVMAFDAQAPTL